MRASFGMQRYSIIWLFIDQNTICVSLRVCKELRNSAAKKESVREIGR